MADFLGEDWIAALRERAETVETAPELTLVLEQRITGEPAATWHVEIAGGRVRIGRGPHPAPTLTLTNARAVAEAIHRGELSASRAFLDGDLRIGGDIEVLLQHRADLETVAGLLAAT